MHDATGRGRRLMAGMMAVNYSQWAIVAIAALLVGVLVTTWFSQKAFNDLNRATTRRSQAWRTLVKVDELGAALTDVESGGRGFALTNQQSFLEPYLRGKQSVPKIYPELKQMVAKAGPARVAWTRLDELVQQRLAIAAHLVQERQQMPADQAFQDLALLSEGKLAMDEIRQLLGDLEALEKHEIEAIDLDAERFKRSSEKLSVIESSLSLGFAVLAIVLIRRERRFRFQAERELQEQNLHLDEIVTARTQALNQARQQLADFATDEQRQVEMERRRIAREVHDQIGQVFTAIRLILKTLPDDTMEPGQRQALDGALDLGIHTSRRITAELRPPLLDDLGLGAALAHLVEQLPHGDQFTWSVAVHADSALDEAQSLSLFRIAQEATHNILKYAQATKATMSGDVRGDQYVFSVQDDGVGFVPGQVRVGALGLVSIQERAGLMGGTAIIRSAERGGTQIEVSVPLKGVVSHEIPVA